MSKLSTLFILGAGASKDYGFPLGIDLLKELHAEWISPDDDTTSAYLRILDSLGLRDDWEPIPNAIKKIKQLGGRLYFSSAESIDDFLGKCKEKVDVEFGKISLVKLILRKEAEASREGEYKLFNWNNNWLRILFGREFRLESVERLIHKLEMEKIVFVTFNYDRTLEHFLYTAFQHYYGIEDDKVLTRIMNLIEIIHVYGNITHLKWEIGCAGCKVNFGETGVLEFNELQECAGNIKIINEDRASLDKTKAKIHSFVEEAKRVCILGFGFQESNLPLLGIEEYKLKCEGKIIPKKKFFYTKLGLSKGYHEKIFGMLGGSSRANYFDTPIYDFMVHEY